MKRGMSTEEIHELCYIDRWFLLQLRELLDVEGFLSITKLSELSKDDFYEVKKRGFKDKKISFATKSPEKEVCACCLALGVCPAYKRVDTCAAECEADTPYMYSSYDGECEANPRASRTIPFVSKAIGHPLAKYVSLLILGKYLQDIGFT